MDAVYRVVVFTVVLWTLLPIGLFLLWLTFNGTEINWGLTAGFVLILGWRVTRITLHDRPFRSLNEKLMALPASGYKRLTKAGSREKPPPS